MGGDIYQLGWLSRYSVSLYLGRFGVRNCRSQWPGGLRRGSAANRLLGLRLRIRPGSWVFVLCVVQTEETSKDNKDKRITQGK